MSKANSPSLSKSRTAHTYQNLSYRQLQAHNKQTRSQLNREDQQFLKTNGFKNVGWTCAIELYEKIADYLIQYRLADESLEELFLEADRIGNKYQSPEEIAAFQAALAIEVEAIADLVDEQFPDDQPEVIDYGSPTARRPTRKNARGTFSPR
jgi:hypothetical protein